MPFQVSGGHFFNQDPHPLRMNHYIATDYLSLISERRPEEPHHLNCYRKSPMIILLRHKKATSRYCKDDQ